MWKFPTSTMVSLRGCKKNERGKGFCFVSILDWGRSYPAEEFFQVFPETNMAINPTSFPPKLGFPGSNMDTSRIRDFRWPAFVGPMLFPTSQDTIMSSRSEEHMAGRILDHPKNELWLAVTGICGSQKWARMFPFRRWNWNAHKA